MITGGALWFPDLTVADPYYLLPVTLAGAMFIGAEAMLADSMPGADEKQKATSRLAMRIFSVLAPVLTCTLPSGLQLYFLASTVVTVGQAKILFNPVRDVSTVSLWHHHLGITTVLFMHRLCGRC